MEAGDIVELKKRCERFTKELGLPVTRFCKNIDLAVTTYYKWQRDEIKFSEKRLNSIDEYLKKYGF